jgi:hypothetical protein
MDSPGDEGLDSAAAAGVCCVGGGGGRGLRGARGWLDLIRFDTEQEQFWPIAQSRQQLANGKFGGARPHVMQVGSSSPFTVEHTAQLDCVASFSNVHTEQLQQFSSPPPRFVPHISHEREAAELINVHLLHMDMSGSQFELKLLRSTRNQRLVWST